MGRTPPQNKELHVKCNAAIHAFLVISGSKAEHNTAVRDLAYSELFDYNPTLNGFQVIDHVESWLPVKARIPRTPKVKLYHQDDSDTEVLNYISLSGAIRETKTQLRPKEHKSRCGRNPHCNTFNKEEVVQHDFPSGSAPPEIVREFSQKHYEQLLSFIAERAYNEKFKVVRSRLSYSGITEQETENTSQHHDPRGSKRKRRGEKRRASSPFQASSRSGSVDTRLGANRQEQMKRDTSELIRSYITSSSERQREIERDYHRRLAHLVKEIKQSNAKASTSKAMKKSEKAPKDKGLAIFMVHSWRRNVRPRTGMNPLPQMDISFPQLTNANHENYLIVICAEIGGHDVPRMFVDGGSTLEILY
ncbi:hypothetical protein Tco_1286424 [Tanacetum coccineum]